MTWPTKTDFVDGDVLTAAQVNNIGTNLNEFDPSSATSGQVWFADGAGSGSFADLSAGGMTLISSGSLNGLSSLNLTSIPQTYEHLQLRVYDAYMSTTGKYVLFQPNGSSVTTAYVKIFRDSVLGTTTFQSTVGTSAAGLADILYISDDNYNRAHIVCNILYYTHAEPTTPGDEQKLVNTYFRASNSAGNSHALGYMISSPYQDTAITSINIFSNGTFTAGNYELWGIK